MKKIEKKDIWLLAAQVAVWVLIIFAMPLATYLSTQDAHATRTSILVVWGLFQSPLVIYFLNFYLLGPYLFFKHRYWWFTIHPQHARNGAQYVDRFLLWILDVPGS